MINPAFAASGRLTGGQIRSQTRVGRLGTENADWVLGQKPELPAGSTRGQVRFREEETEEPVKPARSGDRLVYN
jgi:hypothetical protein